MWGLVARTILIPVVSMMLLLLIPFISILMLIKIRREMKINKGIKKGIKSGVWLNEYKYTISPKFQKKIDKYALKQSKKQIDNPIREIKEIKNKEDF